MFFALNMTWTHCEVYWDLDFEPLKRSGGQPVALGGAFGVWIGTFFLYSTTGVLWLVCCFGGSFSKPFLAPWSLGLGDGVLAHPSPTSVASLSLSSTEKCGGLWLCGIVTEASNTFHAPGSKTLCRHVHTANGSTCQDWWRPRWRFARLIFRGWRKTWPTLWFQT